ncbi:prepilin-type N-terminal cleavage/methylation domain-containing protein [Pseudomonas sp. ABC1]|uniref:prepilin-type N-terminal cleavage/methylation domain-containing protein n=1 Tax=Pseudomonas sp. ABC1 TaxID=2748080 RepID=UPI0015C3F744|nr:prepilin-type N-terminal cleavage/methylation domain-containing protein [Pseudomonas sp. ABC1]QLF92764.1 prepilin-type N-terminal cleavage/methylation domain-containing protein [Pseudomonas sp. ABC1]
MSGLNAQARERQAGLSLTELLLCLAIGSSLLLGISQLHAETRLHYLRQQNQLEHLEDSRHLFLLLEQEIAKAGYRRQPDQAVENIFSAQQFSAAGKHCALASGQTIAHIDDSSFCLRYQPALPGSHGCDGKAIDNVPPSPYSTYPGQPVISLFSFDAQTHELRCNGDAIAQGIERLRFEYGASNGGDTAGLHFNSTPTPGQTIRAIRYRACLVSTQKAGSPPSLDATCADKTDAQPGRHRPRDFGVTLALRNIQP